MHWAQHDSGAKPTLMKTERTSRALITACLCGIALFAGCGDDEAPPAETDSGQGSSGNDAAGTTTSTSDASTVTTSTSSSTTAVGSSSTTADESADSSSGAPTTSTGEDPLTQREIVELVLEEGLGQGDLEVIETYVAEGYIQHSTLAADGRQGFIDAIESFEGMYPGVEIARVFEMDDRVFTHAVYDFPGLGELVAFDVFRFEDGVIAEHWDALQTRVPDGRTVSGNGMVDGPTEPSDRRDTEANIAIVDSFVQDVLIGGDFGAITNFVSTESYVQHNPLVADGLDGFNAFVMGLAEQGIGFGYTSNEILLGEGDFVLIGSEGFFGPVEAQPFAVFYDLFRLEDGLIVEHWDVIPTPAPDPTMLPHDNGLW